MQVQILHWPNATKMKLQTINALHQIMGNRFGLHITQNVIYTINAILLVMLYKSFAPVTIFMMKMKENVYMDQTVNVNRRENMWKLSKPMVFAMVVESNFSIISFRLKNSSYVLKMEPHIFKHVQLVFSGIEIITDVALRQLIF